MAIGLGLGLALCGKVAGQEPQGIPYPPARRGPVVDQLHGRAFPDPYRWMEDTESADTRAWVDAQERLLSSRIAERPERTSFAERVAHLRRVDSRSTPSIRGARRFFTTTTAGARHPVLWLEVGEDEPRKLIDFDNLMEGESWSSGGNWPDPTGRLVAIGLSPSPSEWNRLRVFEVEADDFLEEEVREVSGSPAWRRDGTGFFYRSFPPRVGAADLSQAMGQADIRFHAIGSDPSDDPVIYSETRAGWMPSARVSWDGRWLIVSVRHGSSFSGLVDEIRLLDLADPQATPWLAFAEKGVKFSYEGNEGERFWLQTTHGAPRRRFVEARLDALRPEHWRELVPECEHPLANVSVLEDVFALAYDRDAIRRVAIHDREGNFLREIGPTASGWITWLPDAPDESLAYTVVSGLTDPGSIWRVDVRTGAAELVWRPELEQDPERFETRQVFYRGYDGTRIPMFVAGLRGTLDGRGDRPLFLYGYGAYGWSAFPWYQPHIVAWMERGGLYALPGIRGGGEYGSEWHQAGVGAKRQVVIDDYLAAAEFLIEAGYTTPTRLVADGGSASGVVAAAAAMQRPELFGAALIELPKLDMLRYHLFGGGDFILPEYGSPEDCQAFEVLASYSPLHNVVEGRCYPPMLVLVGEEDATSPPFHGYKFVAEMQARACAKHPCLLKVVRETGHTYGSTPEQWAGTWGEVYAFLMDMLEVSASE